MRISDLALLGNQQKIAILNDPSLILFDALEEKGNPRADETNCLADTASFAELHSLLDIIAAAIDANQIHMAEEVINIIPTTTADGNAWASYYRGYIHMQRLNRDKALTEFCSSIETKPISWAYFHLASLEISSNPTAAYRHYRDSIHVEPKLNEEAKSHAINWLNNFFDEELYLRFNPDLAHLPARALVDHYLSYGFEEKRIGGYFSLNHELESVKATLPKEFSWKSYLESNNDLEILIEPTQTSLIEAEYILTKHYIEHGKKEGRLFAAEHDLLSGRASESMYQKQKDYLARRARLDLERFLASAEEIYVGDARNPIITVIIVVHNKCEYTLKAIESVSSSSLKSVALIVVDNNSTDFTPEVLSRTKGNVLAIQNNYNLHFLRSVNQALMHVRTPYLCILNNDAFLEKATLEEAIECLMRYSGNAIVGGMVLHADGYIQDAGSVVFSDGSCRGLGRRMEPGHHLFNFERTVDYVSGAFLATTTSIFHKLGGFDERYAPAYYEETDMCFRAHQLNIPVIYSPKIVIRHIEFGSSQTSEQAIAQMSRNRLLFKDAHSARLRTQIHPSSFDQNDITCLMHGHLKSGPKILCIDDRVPRADLGSGFSRSHDIVKEFREITAHLTIFATDHKRSSSSVNHLPTGVECIEGSREDLLGLLACRNHFYDFIFVSREHNQDLFGQILDQLAGKSIVLASQIVFDAESLFSIRDYTFMHLKANGKVLGSLADVDIDAVVHDEVKRFERADIITSVSDFEIRILSRFFPAKRILHVGHPFAYLSRDEFDIQNRDCVTFLGAVHEEASPNHDSLVWMRDEILPRVAESEEILGKFKLEIAGNVTCSKTLDIISDIEDRFGFVEFVGRVDDLEALFGRSRAFIAPTRYAAGVPHKIHLASSFGLPTISTTIVAEQMGWLEDGSILTADSGLAFARAMIECYNNYESFEAVRRRMIRSFNRDCSLETFKRNILQILSFKQA